jgi:hypothetical protein
LKWQLPDVLYCKVDVRGGGEKERLANDPNSVSVGELKTVIVSFPGLAHLAPHPHHHDDDDDDGREHIHNIIVY